MPQSNLRLNDEVIVKDDIVVNVFANNIRLKGLKGVIKGFSLVNDQVLYQVEFNSGTILTCKIFERSLLRADEASHVEDPGLKFWERIKRSCDAEVNTQGLVIKKVVYAPTHVMKKEKCIELLERYRAERDKLAKGRRFELRLRDNVVNEALERAIELLKGGQS